MCQDWAGYAECAIQIKVTSVNTYGRKKKKRSLTKPIIHDIMGSEMKRRPHARKIP